TLMSAVTVLSAFTVTVPEPLAEPLTGGTSLLPESVTDSPSAVTLASIAAVPRVAMRIDFIQVSRGNVGATRGQHLRPVGSSHRSPGAYRNTPRKVRGGVPGERLARRFAEVVALVEDDAPGAGRLAPPDRGEARDGLARRVAHRPAGDRERPRVEHLH